MAAAAASTFWYTAGVHSRNVASPAAVASGFPDSVPAWYTGPDGASRSMISARPPNAAAGSPPPITLPNVIRSPATPSRPYQPDLVTRNPVSTSSMMSSEPCSAASAASTSLNPGSGGTTPMFAGHASVIRHAIRGPCAANTPATAAVSLNGSTSVSAAAAPVTPGLSGRANVATPDPAAASSAANIVASVPELTSRTLSTGARAAISSASSTSARVAAPNEVPRPAAAVTAATTAGCAWPRIIGPHEQTRSTYCLPPVSVR